jgi:PilZ domain
MVEAEEVCPRENTMSLIAKALPNEASPRKLFRMSAERRQTPRVILSIGGRVMLEDRSEHPATAVDASLKAMTIATEVAPRLGERVVGYFYTIGRVEGTVARLNEKGFVLEIVTTLVKRDKLAGQLTWLANRDMLNLPEDRRHDRIVPRDPRIMVRQLSNPTGAELPGHLIDVSRSGAAASVRGATFKKGDEVMLGTTPARVVRAFDGGIAVEFYGQVPEHMFSENIQL